MKAKQNKKGFTLIELLVVITIIGILATWATTVYTSQIQKARDTTRINDIKALQSAIEQVYQDRAEYPPTSKNFLTDSNWVTVKTYMPKIPRDPKNWQACNRGNDSTPPTCVYAYITNPDNNGINKWRYSLTTAFESEWKIKSDWEKDWWVSKRRWEVWNWINLPNASSSFRADFDYDPGALNIFKTASWVLKFDWTSADGDWETQNVVITINWD